jgi:Polyketide synthase modules and related proteins
MVTEVTPWDGGLAAFNSMSITGTYAHVLLKSFDKKKPEDTHVDGLPRLLIVSSRTEPGLGEILDKVCNNQDFLISIV